MKKRTRIRSTGRFRIWYIPLIVIAVALVLELTTSIINAGYTVDNPAATYECDVKWLFKLKTTIEVDGDPIDGEVKGNFAYGLFKKVHDPLEFRDSKGNIIAKASDEYHFISQDDHCIVDSEDRVMAVMEGQFQLLGEKYKIYDSEGTYIGYLQVGPTSTKGGFYSENGKLWAAYKSHFLLKDFEIIIDESAPLPDEAIIMLFASYYSDFDADNSNGSSHSNSSNRK